VRSEEREAQAALAAAANYSIVTLRVGEYKKMLPRYVVIIVFT
jgi:hypothetical protein